MKMLTRLVMSSFALTALSLGSQAQEIGLDTTYASGNGQSGNMFDVKAEEDIIVTRIDAHIDAGTFDVEVYTTPTTYQGKTTSLAQWTLIGKVSVIGLGDVSTGGQKTPIPMPLDIPISAGQTMGFYVTLANGSSINYTNGIQEGAVLATDSVLTIYEGLGVGYPASGTFSPRDWNGTMYYTLAGATAQQGYKEVYAVGGTAKTARDGTGATAIGDLTNDGIIDYVLGAPGMNLGKGSVSFHNGSNGQTINTIPGLAGAKGFGTTLLNTGDTNGDGKDDLLVGAPGDGPLQFGRAYFYLNGSTFPTYIFAGPGDAFFGAAFANVGDIDGDTVPDYLIGAPGHDSALSTDTGSFELYSGASGTSLFVAESALSNDRMATALAGLGDVNNDGTPDFLVGSPGASQVPLNGDRFGRVEVWSGATKAPLYEIFGTQTDADFGASLTSIGDVNGDGKSDFAVGAPLFDAGLGAAFVYSGSNGALLYSLYGDEPDAHFGTSVTLVGDTTGDNTPDLAIGAPGIQSIWGYVDIVNAKDGTPISATNRLIQGHLSTFFGKCLVPLGDINHDTLDDFIITAPGEYSSPNPEAGLSRTVTIFGAPLIDHVDGVHSLDTGEYLIIGTNFVNPTVLVDGVPTAATLTSPVELRIPVTPEQPGGFHNITVQNNDGSAELLNGLARYPAFDADPAPRIGDPIDFTLDNGDEGIYFLFYGVFLYPTPAPFENLGWYHGLELNGLWPLTAGTLPPGTTKTTITIPPVTSTAMIGVPVYVQAFTTQNTLGYAGFTKTLPLTLLPALP